MQLKTQYRLCGAVLLALGVPTIFTAVWGVLWTMPEASWFDRYPLRLFMFLAGAWGTWLGLWYGLLIHTIWVSRLWAWYDEWKWNRDYRRWKAEQNDERSYAPGDVVPWHNHHADMDPYHGPLSPEEHDREVWGDMQVKPDPFRRWPERNSVGRQCDRES